MLPLAGPSVSRQGEDGGGGGVFGPVLGFGWVGSWSLIVDLAFTRSFVRC
jgi:hypothetical protein